MRYLSTFRRLLGLCVMIGSMAKMGPLARASNIVTDFSNTSNPNGVWSYYYGTSSTTQTLYTLSQATTCAGLPCWHNGGGIPDSINMAQNITGTTVYDQTIADPTGTLWLDPEEYSIAVVFTAPSTATYDIVGNFLGIDVDQNSHPVDILENGVPVYTNTISVYGQDDSFNFSESLSAGETLSFYVGTGSSGCPYCYLSTALDGTVTPVSATPEPSSLLLCLGAAALLMLRIRCGHDLGGWRVHK